MYFRFTFFSLGVFWKLQRSYSLLSFERSLLPLVQQQRFLGTSSRASAAEVFCFGSLRRRRQGMESAGKRKRHSSSRITMENESKKESSPSSPVAMNDKEFSKSPRNIATKKEANSSSPKKPCTATQFQVTEAKDATSLTDGVSLGNGAVVLPWVGYGTYKIGKDIARESILNAFRHDYRCIDTAFVYGGETTETNVGLAIQDAISEGTIKSRDDVFITTKHWRSYHGYEPTFNCLDKSLKRLNVDKIDLWLVHWPGPAYNTMSRRKDLLAEHGPFHFAKHSEEDLPQLRSETWRAMEDSVKDGKVNAIGVSNFSISHLEALKKTATIWPPAVNQIECHPLYPQTELVEYCQKEGIVVQAYASLGGQDAGKKFWKQLYKPEKGTKGGVTKLVNSPPVLELAKQVQKSPAQVLLRWALEKNIAIIPKSSSTERMDENSHLFDFSLSQDEMNRLDSQLQAALAEAAETEEADIDSMARLCWRNDPLRSLDFD